MMQTCRHVLRLRRASVATSAPLLAVGHVEGLVEAETPCLLKHAEGVKLLATWRMCSALLNGAMMPSARCMIHDADAQ